MPRHLRLEVTERMARRRPRARRRSTRATLAAAAPTARARPASTSIAIVFLHAYANPRHEAEAARLIARRHPEHRGRPPRTRWRRRSASTSARRPRSPTPTSSRSRSSYLDADGPAQLAGLGIPAPLLLMLSNGGLTHVAEAKRTPVQMLESGPAAGALAAAFFGARGQPAATCSPSTWAARPPSSRLVDGGEPLDRLQLRGRAAAALHRGQRPADPHLDHRADRDRRRRRHHRRTWTRSACSRSGPRSAGSQPGPGRLRPRRHASPR